MSRLPAIQTESANGKAKQLLEAVQAKLKITPNMTRVMANSPAVLEAYLQFSAALEFAHAVVASKGQVSDIDVATVRAAGFNDGEIAEIIAHVALNIFTNYFNTAAQVEVDFPKIALRHHA